MNKGSGDGVKPGSECGKKHNILWAPWRVKYVTSPGGKECIFCTKPASENDRENYILHRGKKAFVILNIFPYNNGHTMVAPYEHTGDIERLPGDTYSEMMELTRRVIGKMRETMNPQGFNTGMNIGRPAGSSFDEHLHIHIVPRWEGDTNFMPVISGDSVISESLESAYEKLRFD